jgi:hypothetical protein
MMTREDATFLPRPRRAGVAVLVILLVAALGLTACTNVQLVGPYDQQTVDAVTALLQKIEGQLIRLERVLEVPTPEALDQAKYERYTEFYDEIKLDLSLIRVRANALPQNERTVKQIDELGAAIGNFEQLHRGGLNRQVVSTSRRILSQAIEAILKAEFAKKR